MDQVRERNRDSWTKLKLRLMLCLWCCYRGERRQSGITAPEAEEKPRLLRSSSAWLRSRAQEIPELREKCRSMISRMRRSRKHSSTDFRYDPLSYALNFDEGEDETQLDDFRYRNFSSRLTATPTASPGPAGASMEIACS
ncbi:hypothetical protein H6P81_000728 [Aristolochia fimbriata]|uniref:Uncharacterized protein n=1 Tax=Aristolochia fimbriata TaxID=158543 RepID=A0AAV7F7J1_ARIFI|nr:hypothetical protein H6P81_000728 [Aristolochia fimbriata]